MEKNNQNLPNKSAGAPKKETEYDKSYDRILVSLALCLCLLVFVVCVKSVFDVLVLVGVL